MTASDAPRDTYARKAISQIPRILGNMDRSLFSPTYGCMHRDYWLDKTSDFADAVRQFAVHALALVYRHDFPGNIYRGQPKVRDWAIAGLDFWASIQHREGSFDEFYPYERGWVGPSAFTTYTAVESFKLLETEIPVEIAARVRQAIRKAAWFIASGESEQDHLANHHAMACLAVWKAYELLGEKGLRNGYRDLWKGFLAYHNCHEGWSREYDGIDPGYLSATVSFLAKIYATNPDAELLKVIRQSVEMCSFFAYPDGSYAGSMGSRNTQHFYPHGFELLGEQIPLAKALAEKMLEALSHDQLVPPEIISDRYLVYRVPEFLLAYLDYAPRNPKPLEPLPYEREPFARYFPGAGIHVRNTGRYYAVSNLAKGGVIKLFDKGANELVHNDCGWIGKSNGRVVTSQWIDPRFQVHAADGEWEVSGHFHRVASQKVFTVAKNLVFRLVLLLTGWSPRLSHLLKGRIRKMLMLGQRPAPIHFQRSVAFSEDSIHITDEIIKKDGSRVTALSCADEFSVRYVPQSRYFQSHELRQFGQEINPQQLHDLNATGSLTLTRRVSMGTDHAAK